MAITQITWITHLYLFPFWTEFTIFTPFFEDGFLEAKVKDLAAEKKRADDAEAKLKALQAEITRLEKVETELQRVTGDLQSEQSKTTAETQRADKAEDERTQALRNLRDAKAAMVKFQSAQTALSDAATVITNELNK